MNDDQASRIEMINTHWSAVKESGSDHADSAHQARLRLFHSYQKSAYRYLLGAVRDRDLADELFQEFSMRLVSGRFANADQDKGRFRDYLRRALQNLVTDRHRLKKKSTVSLDDESRCSIEAVAQAGGSDDFDDVFRKELLAKAMDKLKDYERETARPLATALRLKMEMPKASSSELADRLTGRVESPIPISAPAYRKTLERARKKFAEVLIKEVAQTLDDPSATSIEEELVSLRLHSYLKTP